MRGRRSSGSSTSHHQSTPSVASPAPSAFTPPANRSTRSSESIHEFINARGAQSSPAQSADAKMISALVARLVNKLPCNSGIRIAVVESEPVVRQSVTALVQLSRLRLEGVALALVQVLDSLLKGTASTLASTPLDVIQSQLFILIVLSSCLTQHWQAHAQAAVARNPGASSSTPELWTEPLPLDDGLVKHILSSMSALAKQASDAPSGSRKSNSEQIAFARHMVQPSYGSKTPTSQNATESEERIPDTLQAATARTRAVVARIVFYVSASNWSFLMSRFRTRVQYLGTQGSSASDETSDLGDLRLLEWANLDRARLSQVLQELSSVFLHLKRAIQPTIAGVLRLILWNWIDNYPAEFLALVESNRKLEGGADVLFDILHSLAESDPSSSSSASMIRLKAIYPAMTALLVVCPDVLKKAAIAEVTGGRLSPAVAKKVHFLETLRKAARSPKMAAIVMACYVDLAKGALCLPDRMETTGLRSLLPEIRPDIKEAVLTVDSSTEVATDLLADALVVMYRSDPLDTVESVMPRLLGGGDIARQTAVLRATSFLAVEKCRLTWHPSTQSLFTAVGGQMSDLVKSSIRDLVGDRHQGFTQTLRPASDAAMQVSDLLCAALQLYDADMDFIFYAEQPVEMLHAISHLLVDPAGRALRMAAAETIARFIRWQPIDKSATARFIDISGSACDSFLVDSSREVLDAFHQGGVDELRVAATVFRDLIEHLVPIVEPDPDWSASRESAAAVCFIAMLSLLQFPDLEQYALNLRAVRSLVHLYRSRAEYLKKLDLGGSQRLEAIMLSNAARAEAFGAFGKLPVATGRQQQQRQLRKVVRAAARPSPLQVAVWMGYYRRWHALTGRIVEGEVQHDDAQSDRRRGLTFDVVGLDEDEAKEWQNLTAMLAAGGAACSSDQPSLSLSDMILDSHLPAGYDDRMEPATAMQSYIQRTTDFLVSESVFVRETVKDALGSDLSAQQYRPVVQQISSLLSHAFEANGVVRCSEPFSIFVEQSIAMLRLAVDRLGQTGEASLLNVDLGDIVLKFAQYLHRLGRGSVALRIKIRLCQLTDVMLQKKDHIVLSNGGQVRNALLEWFSDWTQEQVMDGDASLHSNLATVERLQRELDLASLRAIVSCSDGLVLQAFGSDPDEASGTMKSRLFYRHFQFLSRLLSRPPPTDDVSPRHTPSLSSRSTAKPASVDSRDSGLLKDLAIAALSNLLSANVDVGLRHSLSMGYHEDESTRVAFMHVLSNILRQGTRFTGLSGQRDSAAAKVFTQTLTRSDLSFALAICDTCPSSDVEEMSMLLIRAFEQRGTLLHLLKALIEKEVAQTQSESELFRANSMVTRMLSSVARMHGYNYVRASLSPLIQSLCDKPSDYAFELDPVKLDSAEDAARNADHLKVVCQALLDIICSSGPRVPVLFRAIGHHIWEVVGARFPDSRHSAVGAFIFLRFFCPAIVAPESVDLDVPLDPQNKDVRRALLMITKVIQNLANNVVFGNKEPFMRVLNPFLSENIRQVTKFLSDIAIRPRSADVAASVAKSVDSLHSSYVRDADSDELILHRYAAKHIDKLDQALSASFSASTRSPDKRNVSSKTTLATLQQALLDLGLPAEHSRLSASAREQAYDEFMRQNSGRNIDPVASAFYEGPMSQTLDDVTDFFDLIVDLSGFSPTTEFPFSWLKQSIVLCPPGILPCLDVLVLYNPNTYARKRVRRHITELSSTGLRGAKTIAAACSPSELAEYVTFTTLALPESTLSLSYDAEHVFTNVQLISDYEQEVPVVLKLGYDCLQIASWKKQELSPQLRSYVIDVIQLEDIDDVVTGASSPPDHLVIKHNQTQVATLVTKQRDLISQCLRAAKAKTKTGHHTDRMLRPGDVPGTLLNVALLNMSSSDPTLRVAAYDLVAELTCFFQYELSARVLSAPGLFIPGNASDFITGLSQKLASTAPHLTLEFFREWAVGFTKADMPQKTVCIDYIVPWVANLVTFCEPSREDRANVKDKVREVLRSLISVTAAERDGLHLVIQRQIWAPISQLPDHFVDLVVDELLRAATDTGIGSERAETAANTLVSISSVSVRGRVIAKLRKVLAQTYLKPSNTLKDNQAWSEICALTRVNMVLSFSPRAAMHTQIFFPEILHVVTLLVGAGPLLMRLSVHAIVVNILQSLATLAPAGEVDIKALQTLLAQMAQPDMLRAFGLMQSAGGLTLYPDSHRDGGPDTSLLNAVEKVTLFLNEVISSGSATTDLANVWRARWMGLVAATCFQHNPATQPQAFIVLGSLARDEVDDDLVYQILVALSTSLQQFTESSAVLVIAMLRCLARVVVGLSADSRYASSMFWLSVGVLQLGHIQTYVAGVELLTLALQAMRSADVFSRDMESVLLEARQLIGESAVRLDQAAGVSFETSLSFSLAALLSKGLRHPTSRTSASAAISTLLEISTETSSANPGRLGPDRLGYFFALLPVMSSSPSDVKSLFALAGLPKPATDEMPSVTFDMVSLPDNSTTLLLMTLVTAILNNASSDLERIILYRFLAEAADETPEVVTIALESLLPRMTAILATTSNTSILDAVSTILQRTLSSAPNGSLSRRTPSEPGSDLAPDGRDKVLEDLGMRSLAETTFPSHNAERTSSMAKWVAALIHSLTA